MLQNTHFGTDILALVLFVGRTTIGFDHRDFVESFSLLLCNVCLFFVLFGKNVIMFVNDQKLVFIVFDPL